MLYLKQKRSEKDGPLRKKISKGVSFHVWDSLDHDSRTWFYVSVSNRPYMDERNERCYLRSLSVVVHLGQLHSKGLTIETALP